MPKNDVGGPKWLANKMKSKGLQKLRWYCQMCEKQCRDENGFKCHVSSESHQRQLLLFGENTGSYLAGYSKDFEKGFNDILKRQYNERRVKANVVYQQYIADKEHVHMNSTVWVTLTSYVKHLERTKKCIVEDTEKGWYITWVEKSEEQLEQEKKDRKKNKMLRDDEEITQKYVQQQIEKAKAEAGSDEEFEATELLKDENEVLKLDLKLKPTMLASKATDSKVGVKSVFKEAAAVKKESDKIKKEKEDSGKRKMSALEEIMEQGKKKQREEEAKKPKVRSWLREGIVVKVVTKSLGDKYYKKKGWVKEVIDDFAALVVTTETGAKVKLDQDHLETVVPGEGREVVVLWGEHGGEVATLRSIDTEKFSASLKLVTGQNAGDKIKLPYEQFSKKWEAK